MNRIYQVLFVVLICGWAEAQWFAPYLAYSDSSAAFCEGKSNGLYCSNCNTLVFCPGGSNMKCDLLDPSNAFCNDTKAGAAVCQAVSTCISESSAPAIEQCLRIGRYPDPYKCDVYQQCSEVGKPAVKYGCPPGTRFDPKTELCYKPIATSPCYTFDASAANGLCKRKPFQDVVHPLRPDVYVTCDGKYNTKMCKSIYEQYNTVTRECEFKCQKDGFFRDTKQDDHFITCVKNGAGWITIDQPCGEAKYNDELGHCAATDTGSNGSSSSTTEVSSGST